MEQLVEFAPYGVGGFFVLALPTFVIHLSYYFSNRKDSFLYYPDQERITINRNGVQQDFFLSDIESVVRVKSFPLAEDRLHWFPWDNYNYSIIRVRSGEEYVVTSLLVPNMDLPIDSSKIKLKKSFFPFI